MANSEIVYVPFAIMLLIFMVIVVICDLSELLENRKKPSGNTPLKASV
jgi:hypothetical protein